MGGPFQNRVALVTGASRGIGAATAAVFAAGGAAVGVNFRADRDGAEATLADIEESGGRGLLVQADVSEPADARRLVAEVEGTLGHIDVLVNNAAAFGRTSFLDVELEEFDRVWAANVRGLFYLSQIVARSMAIRGHGAIVHVSSILARLSVPARTSYSASKGAVESLTRAMAIDLADTGIRVNAVAPGLIATDALLAGMPDPELQAAIQRHVPGGRFGRAEEVARVVVFLASDEARYVNGAVIPVDAGLGAREAGPAS